MSDPTWIRDLLSMTQRLSEKSEGGEVPPRLRICARCSSLEAEMRKHDPDWRPAEVLSWESNGVRYYGGLCRGCSEFEGRQRKAKRADQARADEVREQRPQIGMAMRPRRSWQAPK